ncbi:glutamine synthetase III [Sphingobacterium spiritivorum]|uniref:Glutamate--ammonia ligase, catalytic domain protein n=2 Tax=Sphingobacterium spiritivorum TaxID=258 RepID=D7VM17_SPHSI|nr:glutamine synthetase III [Sphingobacterium spiritivorum]EFK58022.1 glutamate--ammonia ligase, catalytic domain protein [Sphingobacterium spiritivorum ATCC 33861]QQT34716.1 glutamine synthetase III [Sphingobacterium spiritivorum]WQD35600.1 glutamine synthetase III [Sphingobacterium spiritivorum]SUJ00948.1 Glutamine synthetase [Sphingobacterium spiritivorum]SUJ24535.1 Glutamine synthetase [Sphingobacterium spiritivorum]
MSDLRFQAVEAAGGRPKTSTQPLALQKATALYGKNVFTISKMKDFLPKNSYKQLVEIIEEGTTIDRDLAEHISQAMKSWAIANGASHYTHWFQPLTGSTAEKHDAFFEPDSDGSAIEKFTADALVQQEPDASSFPNGGIRNTFEARGYTAWDPTSPAFIFETGGGKTLCIPTVFVSYTGESLDYKAPLLKAINSIDKAAVEVAQYFDKAVTKVTPSLGIEQEYFLVDLALYNARPDLQLTGRTLFGHISAKGQQLEDHYFGAIPERVLAFMVDLENESLKLGIPLKTRHNEVAPSQFECAPMFEEINLAIDHNQLLQNVMDQVALRHSFKVLLHEKPYSGVNGSGKHNNWSLITNTGVNLLSPGKTPKNNLMFLTFFVNTIKAVHEHADLLRASIASASNDHRLGANEAPPAIISIFLGSQLDELLEEVESARVAKKVKAEANLWHGIPKIPELRLDNTDRNRTSPFAFTGNKFEFRAVGSSANSALPMTVLNAIVANQLAEFKIEVDKQIKKGTKKDLAILNVVRKYIKESKAIRFEGNGYSDEWEQEAAARGLSNIKSTPKALDIYTKESSLDLFEKMGIYSHRESEARHEILLENFYKKLQIEARVIGEIVSSLIAPAAFTYQNDLITNVKGLKDLGLPKEAYSSQLNLIERISKHANTILEEAEAMRQERKKANALEDVRERSIAYDELVKPYFDQIRYHVNKLEQIVDDSKWPLPKLRELLFIR